MIFPALLPQMANRHGLITGAAGTGKTVTLQTLAERLSYIGVPVFMADVKGDLSGMGAAGTVSPKLQEAHRRPGSGGLCQPTPTPWPSGMCSARRHSGAGDHFRHGAAAARAPAQP